MEMIQGSLGVVSEISPSPKDVSLWVLIEWKRPSVSLMKVMVTVGFVRSYNVDGHNGALKVMMCTQCHVTPKISYMVGFRKVKRLNGN